MFSPSDLAGFTAPVSPPLDLVLTGRLVRLEPLRTAHAEDLFAAFAGRDDLWDYMAWGPFVRVEAFRDWIAQVAGRPDPLFFALIDLATGKAVGQASFMRIVPKDGVIEVGGISFSPALQASPAATEAMVLMMRWAFAAGYRRYEWKCNALNLASRRAAQRLGFSYEGLFRQHMVIKGRNRDTAWFSILDTEWPRLETALTDWLAVGNFDADGRQRSSLSQMTRPLLAARDPALWGRGEPQPH